MTNADIRNLINTILREDLRGNPLSPSGFNDLLVVENINLFDWFLDRYEFTSEVSDAISIFKKEVQGASLTVNTTTQKITLPDDFARHRYLMYRYNGTDYRNFDIVTDGEWGDRLGSSIKVPSLKNPVGNYQGSVLRYSPSTIQSSYLYFGYFGYPTEPYYDYYIDTGDREVALSVGETHTWITGEVDSSGTEHTTGDDDYESQTVELEWRDSEKLKIAYRILASMGISLSEPQFFQYAKQVERES